MSMRGIKSGNSKDRSTNVLYKFDEKILITFSID